MNDIQKAILGVQAQRRQHIANSFSNAAELRESDNIRKADDEEMEEKEEKNAEKEEKETDTEKEEQEESEEQEEKESDEADGGDEKTEKSDIMYSLSGGNIQVTKTGKEIKEQVDSVLLPELNANLVAKETAATEKLSECGSAPTKEVDSWWTGDVKMDVGYRVYDWREMEFYENENRMYPTLSASDEAEKKGNVPSNKAEAAARREYNELVRCICNIKVDIKACEILKTLSDSKQYELTPRQVLTLKF